MSSLEKIYQTAKVVPGYRWTKDAYTDAKSYDEITAIRARLIMRFPFFGICAMGLILVETRALSTLGVDGYHLFYNPDFFSKKLTPDERDFAVAHEVLHIVFAHTGDMRFEKRDHELWNCAIDYVTNDILVLSNFKLITSIKILHNLAYRDMASEEVYDLLDKMKKQEGRSPTGAVLDTHIAIGSGTDKKAQEELRKHWSDIINQAVAAQYEAEMMGKAAGTLPGSLLARISRSNEPKVNWRDVLRYYVDQVISYEYSYSRPNKALFNMGWTVPGFRSLTDEIDLCIALDASGSISYSQLSAFFAEFCSIVESFAEFRVHIWTFDAMVHEQTFRTFTKDNIEEIDQFTVGGRGGTAFWPNFEFMKERELRPKLFIMFTDGMSCDGWGDPDYCDTLFIVAGTRAAAPFGVTAFYEDL